MRTIKAISLTQKVKDWLSNSSQPHVLHVFDNACNLINEQKDVLSIVSPQIGNGPFNMVVESDNYFTEQLSLRSQVSVSRDQLTLGNLTINIAGGKLWNPQPDWEQLHANRADMLNRIPSLRGPIGAKQSPLGTMSQSELGIASSQSASAFLAMTKTPNPQFSDSLVSANIPTATKLASHLAGLGQGLTPSGDDYIMGALYATWIIHPSDIASTLAKEIAKSTAPLTTSLSAAWLRSAGRGEAGQVWHDLFDALLSADKMAVEKTIEKILDVGHTSGADALAGFLAVFNSCVESI